MWPLVLLLNLTTAAATESEAVVVPNSILREATNLNSCEKIDAFERVCGTLGLDSDQKTQARNLVKLLPDTSLIAGCEARRIKLKNCLEQEK